MKTSEDTLQSLVYPGLSPASGRKEGEEAGLDAGECLGATAIIQSREDSGWVGGGGGANKLKSCRQVW